MSRISKEIFRQIPLSSVILPYYSNPLSARKMMLKLCKGSRSIWLESNSQWSNFLTRLRTKIKISWSQTANNHVKYLAKIAPFVELCFSINFKKTEDLTFIKNLASEIENKSLNRFKFYIIDKVFIDREWHFGDRIKSVLTNSEDLIKSVLTLVNLFSGFGRQYEIDFVGKKIQVTELPDWIKLRCGAILGENQWIVSDNSIRFARLLGEYTQIWKEFGVEDWDSSIIDKIKSKEDIYRYLFYLQRRNDSSQCILKSYSDYSKQRHDCLKVLEFAYLDQIYIHESFLNTEDLTKIFLNVKPFLKKMRSFKSITFWFFKEIQEAIIQLDLQELQQNGVKINFSLSNYPLMKYRFAIVADECIVLHTHKEIKALNIKAKGDIEIYAYSLDFTYIINDEYLLCTWFNINKFEINWKLIESKQKIWFPKFANQLKDLGERHLVLIPLNRIKQVSYMVYLGCEDKVIDDNKKFLTNEFDKEICKPLAQPSSLFCLLNKEAKINI